MASAIHQAILSQIRNNAGIEPLRKIIAEWDDDVLLRQMFLNYREQKGLRLTAFGQHIMERCFESFQFQPDPLPGKCLLFLDRTAKLPYYYGQLQPETPAVLIVYDRTLAVHLRLVNGQVAILLDVDI